MKLDTTAWVVALPTPRTPHRLRIARHAEDPGLALDIDAASLPATGP